MKQGLLFIFTLLCLSCGKQIPSIDYYQTVSDKEATESTNQLYSLLFQLTKKGVMLGHQDAFAYRNLKDEPGDSDMKTVCGDYPAVFGWDLGNPETACSFDVDSAAIESIKRNIKKVHQMGGISTISWCAAYPAEERSNEYDLPDSISKAVLPKKCTYNEYIAHLDRLADFFLDLKDEEGNFIPVIFRPFYSANKSKYCWSTEQNSAGEYKQLWTMTVDYLRDTRKVHHLIYAYSVFNVKSPDEFMTYYPGNDYVDIVGSEVYFSLDTDPDGKIFKRDLERNLAMITAFSKRNHKIPSLTETGLEDIKIFNFFSDYVYPIVTKYPISYMLFWKNARNSNKHYFIPVPGHPACEDFIYFVNKPEILTCGNI